jgi:hypothetical protein
MSAMMMSRAMNDATTTEMMMRNGKRTGDCDRISGSQNTKH